MLYMIKQRKSRPRLEREVEKLKKKLLQNWFQTNEFFLEMRSVTRWLEDKENNMSHAEPISLMSLETIQSQLTNQKKFYQSLNDGSDDSSHPVCRLKQLPARLSVIMQSLPPESKGASLVSKNVDSLVDRFVIVISIIQFSPCL